VLIVERFFTFILLLKIWFFGVCVSHVSRLLHAVRHRVQNDRRSVRLGRSRHASAREHFVGGDLPKAPPRVRLLVPDVRVFGDELRNSACVLKEGSAGVAGFELRTV
jgi:hypothetical protein